MLKLLIFSLILLPSLLFSQKNYQTNVLIKKDFQENTFEENDKKFAKEYFDKIYVKIEAKLKADVNNDKTLGVIFDEKNATILCKISFYMAEEGERRISYLQMSLIDSINNHDAGAWRYPYLKNKAINFREAIEENTENLDSILEFPPFHTLFGAFCSYNQPDFSLQKKVLKNYRNIIITPLDKDSKFQIMHNIATNALISSNYNEYQSARDHLGIFVLPSNSPRDKDDLTVSLRIKEDKDFVVIKVIFFGTNINLTTPIEVRTIVKIDKVRFYKGDYTEANYKLGVIFDNFHINNFMLVN